MDTRRYAIITLVLLMAGIVNGAYGQSAAIKTNLLSDALLNPNIGIEIGTAPRWSLEAEAEFNGWTLSHDRRWKHWSVQPEMRYWLCDRFGGHFLGVHVHGGQYNIGGVGVDLDLLGTDYSRTKDERFQGWFAGAGIGYGYDWVLGRNFNLEAEIGVGYSYTRFDEFLCAGCGKKVGENLSHNYWGITRLAVSLVYLF